MRCLNKLACIRLLLVLVLVNTSYNSLAAAPAWAGVWRGTLGKAPVSVCFEPEGKGRYYYSAREAELILEPIGDLPDVWQETPPDSDKITGYLSLYTHPEKLDGHWTDPKGQNRLPIDLKQVSSKTRVNDACYSAEYHQTQLVSQKIQAGQKQTIHGKSYRILQAKGVSGVELQEPLNKGEQAVARQLKRDFEANRLDRLNCLADGKFNEYENNSDVILWTDTWLVISLSGETFCNTPHSNPFEGADVYNLSSGNKIEPESWFTPSVWKSKYRKIAANSPLGQTVIKYLPPDLEQDCRDGVNENEFYSLWPTPKGMLFKPFLPYILKFCSAESVVPYTKLKPFLNADGLKAVNELMQEHP